MIHGLKPSLAEGGKIKIGGLGKEITSRRGKKFRPPRKDDHFTITKTTRDAAGDLEPDTDLMDALIEDGWGDADEKLRTIPIVLHSDESEEVFPHYYAAYSGKRLACRGDGKAAERRQIADGAWTGEIKELECPCELLKNGRCKPHGVLHCSIRVPGQAVAGAVHRWRTTSLISIEQLVGSLTQIKVTVGVLQGIPLVLRVLPISVTPEGRPTTVYCCHAELRAKDLHSVQQQALHLAQLRNTLKAEIAGAREAYRAMLQPPGFESDEEAAEIEAEFYTAEEEPNTAASRRARAFLRQPVADEDEAPPPIDTTTEPVEAHLEQLHETVQAELTELAEQEQVPPPPPPAPPDGAPSWYDQALAVVTQIGGNEESMLEAAASLGIHKPPEEWSEQDMNDVINEIEK